MRLQSNQRQSDHSVNSKDGYTYVPLSEAQSSLSTNQLTHSNLNGPKRHDNERPSKRFRSLSIMMTTMSKARVQHSTWKQRNGFSKAAPNQVGSPMEHDLSFQEPVALNGIAEAPARTDSFTQTSPEPDRPDRPPAECHSAENRAEPQLEPVRGLSPSTPDNYGDDGASSSTDDATLVEPLEYSQHAERSYSPPARSASTASDTLDSIQESDTDSRPSTPLHTGIVVLLISTGIAAICTELAVDAIPAIVDSWKISHIFLGFIVLPFVGNAAEHVTAAKMALRNRMVLAKSVAVESATQVVLFITPAVVLIGWSRGRRMSLQFDVFEIGSIVLTGFVVSAVIWLGRSNWKQGLCLHSVYVMFALCSIVYRGA